MIGLIVGLALGFAGGVIAGQKLDLYYRCRQGWRWLIERLAMR